MMEAITACSLARPTSVICSARSVTTNQYVVLGKVDIMESISAVKRVTGVVHGASTIALVVVARSSVEASLVTVESIAALLLFISAVRNAVHSVVRSASSLSDTVRPTTSVT